MRIWRAPYTFQPAKYPTILNALAEGAMVELGDGIGDGITVAVGRLVTVAVVVRLGTGNRVGDAVVVGSLAHATIVAIASTLNNNILAKVPIYLLFTGDC